MNIFERIEAFFQRLERKFDIIGDLIDQLLCELRHHHHHKAVIFFIAIGEGGEQHTMTTTPIQAPPGAVQSIMANFAGIVAVIFLEAGDDGVVKAGKGPFNYAVNDPAGLFNVTPGAADGSTPTTLQLKDTTGTIGGSVDVTATDTGSLDASGNPISAKASLAVTPVTPPPPPAITQGSVFFVPQ